MTDDVRYERCQDDPVPPRLGALTPVSRGPVSSLWATLLLPLEFYLFEGDPEPQNP